MGTRDWCPSNMATLVLLGVAHQVIVRISMSGSMPATYCQLSPPPGICASAVYFIKRGPTL